MRLSFLGANREVTGSMHMIEVNDQRILLECGLYQGHRADTYKRNLNFPFDPATIDVAILSHAHIDHSGNLPNLVKQGFAGNIWCTAATRNLCAYMLMDSGYIQEQDVFYLNKRRRRKGEPEIEPIYTRADAEQCLPQLVSIGLHRTVSVADGVDLTFFDAGHILGAAIVQLDIREHATGKKWRLVFSGDIGREELAILNAPEVLSEADIVIMESTYGDRPHGRYDEARQKLRNVVGQTVRRGGKVIIPSLENHEVSATIGPETKNGCEIRLPGLGIPGTDGRGDLVAVLRLRVPEKLNRQQKKILKAFERSNHDAA